MNEAYKIYLKNKWHEAEKIAIELGSPSNQVVCTIFEKMCQPFYYWNKNEK